MLLWNFVPFLFLTFYTIVFPLRNILLIISSLSQATVFAKIIVLLISISDGLLLVWNNTIEFCTLILYHATLLKSFISSSKCFVDSSSTSCNLQIIAVLNLSFQTWCVLYIYSSFIYICFCLITLVRYFSAVLKEVVKAEILAPFLNLWESIQFSPKVWC